MVTAVFPLFWGLKKSKRRKVVINLENNSKGGARLDNYIVSVINEDELWLSIKGRGVKRGDSI